MAAFRCPVCEYTYDEDAGEPREGFPAGTAFSEVPDDWNCPDCGVREKVDFEPAGEASGGEGSGSEGSGGAAG